MKRALPFILLAIVGCEPKRALPKVDLPAPKPWSPSKTTLPKEVVDEAAFLLAHGMGDPRGGEYRTAEIVVGNLWSQAARPTEVHGWVSKDGKWAVGTDGLTHAVRSFGAAADVRKDVEAWFVPTGSGPRGNGTARPAIAISPETISLLLVAGETRLAERAYAASNGQRRFRLDFLARWFDQAVTAHMMGDDATTLRVGRAILRERSAFEARALAANGPRLTGGINGAPDRTDEQFPYLNDLPSLLTDTERRLREAPRKPFDPTKASVAELIDRLDEVSARQMGQPGVVNPADDPIVAALIAKGPEAVGPLLEAVEHDDRLTRSVGFARDFMPGRVLITARRAAFAAFQGIVQVDEIPGNPRYGTPNVAALRAYWKEVGGKRPADRWFGTLADDTAGWRLWEDAAQRLFDHVGTRRTRFSASGTMTGPLNAEAVRGRTNPSLGELLARRSRDVLKPEFQADAGSVNATSRSLRFAAWLGKYEPDQSIEPLRDATRAAIDGIGSERGQEDTIIDVLVPALELRANAGDATAWSDYERLLERMKSIPWGRHPCLRPLVEHRDLPAIQKASLLLTRPGSPLNVVEQVQNQPLSIGHSALLVSPLLKLPNVQAEVLKAFDDRRIVGESWIDERGNAWVTANGKPDTTQRQPPEKADPRTPKPGLRRPYRAADAVASALARLKGAPEFEPYWTVAQKDAALVAMRAFFMANAPHIERSLAYPENWVEPEWMRRMEE